MQDASRLAKNAIKLSILVGLISIFFIVLNFSILLVQIGGVAGIDRKVKSLEQEISVIKSHLE